MLAFGLLALDGALAAVFLVAWMAQTACLLPWHSTGLFPSVSSLGLVSLSFFQGRRTKEGRGRRRKGGGRRPVCSRRQSFRMMRSWSRGGPGGIRVTERLTEGEQRRDHAANAVTCWRTATMARARHELEWLQLEGVAAQVSKEAGGGRVEEGGRTEEGGKRTEDRRQRT